MELGFVLVGDLNEGRVKAQCFIKIQTNKRVNLIKDEFINNLEQVAGHRHHLRSMALLSCRLDLQKPAVLAVQRQPMLEGRTVSVQAMEMHFGVETLILISHICPRMHILVLTVPFLIRGGCRSSNRVFKINFYRK